jgi:hypothetical protein
MKKEGELLALTTDRNIDTELYKALEHGLPHF